MVIAALLSFIALLAAWMAAPDPRNSTVIPESTPIEGVALPA